MTTVTPTRFRSAFYSIPLSRRLPVFICSSVAVSALVQLIVKGI